MTEKRITTAPLGDNHFVQYNMYLWQLLKDKTSQRGRATRMTRKIMRKAQHGLKQKTETYMKSSSYSATQFTFQHAGGDDNQQNS